MLNGNKLKILIINYLDQPRSIPPLQKLYDSLENVAKGMNDIAAAVDDNTPCGITPSYGGLHRVALSLDDVSADVRKLTKDLNKVVDCSGHITGSLNQVNNDIVKLASSQNDLARSLEIVAVTRDYNSGDFDGVRTGFEDWGNALEELADVMERINGRSELILDSYLRLAEIDEALSDVQSSITTLINSINNQLERCGQTSDLVGNIQEGMAEANEGLDDVEDAIDE